MIELTPAERRVALLLIVLLAVGAASDLWQGRRPPAGIAAPAPAAEATPDAPATLPRGSGGTARVGDEPLDLNLASARDLDALPGVGPVLAGRILEQRRRLGAFRAAEDLRAVRGIGPRLYARLEPLVRVGPVPRGGAVADSAPIPPAPGRRLVPGP